MATGLGMNEGHELKACSGSTSAACRTRDFDPRSFLIYEFIRKCPTLE